MTGSSSGSLSSPDSPSSASSAQAGLGRRGFLTTLTGAAAAAAGLTLLPAGTALARDGAATTLDVISDVQGDLADFAHVLDYLDSLGTADALVVNGDLVANGHVSEYEAYRRVLDSHPHPERVISTIGNHELYNSEPFDIQVDRFVEYTGMPGVYSEQVVGDVPLLAIGTTEPFEGTSPPFVTLGAEQLSWLDERLSHYAGSGLPVFVLSHHVLPESVSGTTGQDKARFYDQDFVDEIELLEILGGHPDVVFLSGHTHWSLERDDWAVRKVVSGGDPRGFTVVNTGFVQTLYGPNGNGGERAIDASAAQGLRIDVAQDGTVAVHAHDLKAGTVIRSLEIEAPTS
ncbi:DUF4073 domain-containing protein [Nocardiopsis exhalans]|uniref:DUF4073 domain-containing protein n=1 Tax=Nocardiopsis exhalans TaxID=163604 RepID=A0ABY5DBM1_9ACTN|nr:DUF4073 domain-containing protein [Nocardiopsis exhalans]USY21360.1 DUF4073 domain-containing protein [Nocardiopsis exhalans]